MTGLAVIILVNPTQGLRASSSHGWRTVGNAITLCGAISGFSGQSRPGCRSWRPKSDCLLYRPDPNHRVGCSALASRMPGLGWEPVVVPGCRFLRACPCRRTGSAATPPRTHARSKSSGVMAGGWCDPITAGVASDPRMSPRRLVGDGANRFRVSRPTVNAKGPAGVITSWPLLRRVDVNCLVIPTPWLCAAEPSVCLDVPALIHARQLW